MRVLALVGATHLEPCVYCKRPVPHVELRWRMANGVTGTSWRPEHQCPELKTTLAELIDFDVLGDSGLS